MEISGIIGSYASSLVREFLYRKGLKSTLKALDEEYPRNPLSVNNSSMLIKNLRIEKIIKKNRHSRSPYESILEVIVHNIKLRKHGVKTENNGTGRHNPPNLLALAHLKSLHNELNKKGLHTDFLSLLKFHCGCSDINPFQKGKRLKRFHHISSCGKLNTIKQNDYGTSKNKFDEKCNHIQNQPKIICTQTKTKILTKKEEILESSISDVTTEVESQHDGEISVKEECTSEIISQLNISFKSPHGTKKFINLPIPASSLSECRSDIRVENAYDKEILTPAGSDTFSIHTLDSEPRENIFDSNDMTPSNEERKFFAWENDLKNNCLQNHLPGEKQSKFKVNSDGKPSLFHEKLALISENNTEVTDTLNYSNNDILPKQNQIFLLRKICLANNKNISNMWLGEGFIFDGSPTCYGLIQNKESCSGLLAAVNAYVIKELLFKNPKIEIEYFQPEKSQLEPALLEAMVFILWQAGGNKATVALMEEVPLEINTIEDIIQNVIAKTFTSKKELMAELQKNMSLFIQPGCHGCILFLMSVILSRGVENVIEDMNGTSSIINSNGASTLELVNLLLSGMAVSNVFDNHIKLKNSIIKGIPKRCEIGYLSVKEHFQVGIFLKTPRYPIWLVHNENQFSILFSCQKQLMSDWKVERKFTMKYYSPLNEAGSEIRLYIDTTLTEDGKNKQDTVKALVENCIRTKWKGANVAWR